MIFSLPPPPDPARLPGVALTARFREMGVAASALRQSTEPGDSLRAPLTPTRACTYSDDPAAILIRGFFCASLCSEAEWQRALGPPLFDSCRESGLLIAGPDGAWRSPFHLRTARGLYIWSDYLGPAADAAAVMGAGETTAILYRAGRPESPVPNALDLGCGAGAIALLLAGTAGRVIGSDINPRAVVLARTNAILNGIRNVEFRAGDLFEPVAGERFDRILSQPPYYPLPASGASQVYLHGGTRGDELATRLIQHIPEHLSDAGRALVFTAWPGEERPSLGDGWRVLELAAGRREPNGSRQSMTLIERADAASAGWRARFEIPADAWGSVEPWWIDERIRAENLLRAPESELLAATLRMPRGANFLREGSDVWFRAAAEALTGYVLLDATTQSSLRAIDTAPNVAASGVPPETARAALERGLLRLL